MKPKLPFPAVVILMTFATSLPSIAATPRIDLLGDPASPSAAQRTIVINSNTKYVNVEGGQIVKFVVGDKEFTWNFDGQVSSFDLNKIAPTGVLDHNVKAYIAPNPLYGGGDGGGMGSNRMK